MRSSCRAEHFTIGGRNDTTDNVFGADVFVAIIKTEKYLIICVLTGFDDFLSLKFV